MITHWCLAVFLLLPVSVVVGDDNAAQSVAATPTGTRVETVDGAYRNVTPQELQTLLARKNFPLINVHVPYDGEIERTDASIPYNEVSKIVDALPSDKSAMVVIYCRSGPMSKKATEALVALGFTSVWNLERGMVGWKEAGLPLSTNKLP